MKRDSRILIIGHDSLALIELNLMELSKNYLKYIG